MSREFSIDRNGDVSLKEIAGLRQAVGWDPEERACEQNLKTSYAYYTVRARQVLIGFATVISNGVTDALLVDLMVHPHFQRQGIGQSLVKNLVADIKAAGLRCVQVTFPCDLEPFYRRCGFRICKGAFIDFKSMGGETP